MKIHKILDIYHRALNQHLYSMVRTRRLYYFACSTARRFSSMSIVSMSLCNETEVLLCRQCNEGCGTQYSPCAVCGVTILVHLRAGLVLPLLAHLRSITQCHRVLLSQRTAHLLHAVQEVQLAQSGAVKKPPELKQKICKYLGDFNAL